MAANTAVPDVPERLVLQGRPRIIDIQVETILPPRHNLEPKVAPADRGFLADPLGNTPLADSPGVSEATENSTPK